MNENDKITFVLTLSQAITDGIVNNIRDGNIPEEWNGVQLRQLLQDRFAAANWVKMSKAEKANYNNTILVNNL